MDASWTSGSWTVKDGMADDFIAAWRELAEWTAEQYPGSRAWLLRDRDRPQVFLSAGPWNNDQAITAWRGSSGFQERVARIRGMLESFEARTLDEVARAG